MDNFVPREIALTHHEQEQFDVVNFNTCLLDERYDYAGIFAQYADHEFEASDLYCKIYTIPDFLSEFLSSTNTNCHVGLNFNIKNGQDFGLKHVTIQTEDGPEISVTQDWISTTVSVNGHEMATYLDGNLTSSLLQSFLPPGKPPLEDKALAYALYSQSASRKSKMTYENTDARFAMETIETADDTIHLIDITGVLFGHASGKTIEIKASLCESLLEGAHGTSTNSIVNLSATEGGASNGPNLSIEQIIDNVPIRIKRLTPLHMAVILNALDTLKQSVKAKDSQPT
jgi:hypothetical protein